MHRTRSNDRPFVPPAFTPSSTSLRLGDGILPKRPLSSSSFSSIVASSSSSSSSLPSSSSPSFSSSFSSPSSSSLSSSSSMPPSSSASSSLLFPFASLMTSVMLLLPPGLRRRPLMLLVLVAFVLSSLFALVRVPGGRPAAVVVGDPPVVGRPPVAASAAIGGSSSSSSNNDSAAQQRATALARLLDDLRPEELQTHLEFLSDDLTEGRGTGTRGEALTALYVAAQMKQIGLASTKSATTSPMLRDYILDVPLVGISTAHQPSDAGGGGGGGPALRFRRLGSPSGQARAGRRAVPPLLTTPCAPGDADADADADGHPRCVVSDVVRDRKLREAEAAPEDQELNEDEDELHVELQLWDDFVVTADYQAIEVKLLQQQQQQSGMVEWRVEADELVFVGFGIHADEWARHDYRDAEGAEIDVRGKLVVCFVNEPQPTEEQPDLFAGPKLTYYGRWTYKVEEARRRGARGIFLIYTPETAGYPFTVISNNREPLQVAGRRFPGAGLEAVAWLTESSASALASLAGSSLPEWYEEATSSAFTARRLAVQTSLDVVLGVRSFHAKNVAGLLPGESNECILITAHHDHLGLSPLSSTSSASEDRIYNGAIDNASGVAMMLALARALAKHRAELKRSFLFVSLTGEEAGLIGAQAYVANPPVPLSRTVANINFDMLNMDGPTLDIVGLGSDESKLGPLFAAAALAEGLSVSEDPNPGQGSFIRSDSWVFHKANIPSIYPWTGKHFVGRPNDYAATRKALYVKTKYHGPGDEFDPRWSWAGALQQGRVALRLAYALATSLRPLSVDAEAVISRGRQALGMTEHTVAGLVTSSR